MSTTRADIQVVQENTVGGRDFVIGDIHGRPDLLQQVLDKLGANDRLFMVGDLIDKGPDSLGVIQLVNDPKYKDKVFVIRGNHEQLCLDAIKSLELFTVLLAGADISETITNLQKLCSIVAGFAKTGDKDRRTFVETILGRPLVPGQDSDEALLRITKDLHSHIRNAGSWMTDLYLRELAEQKIQVSVVGNGEAKEARKETVYPKSSRIKDLREYLGSLPVLLLKTGKDPFVLAHAEVPITDQEMFARVERKDLTLPPEQIDYSMWARLKSLLHRILHIRGPNAIPAVVGHSPAINLEEPAVRVESNTINDDVGSYLLDNVMMVDMTAGTAELLHPTPHPEFIKNRDQITAHLQKQKLRGLNLMTVPADGGGEKLVLKSNEEKKQLTLLNEVKATAKQEVKAPPTETSQTKLQKHPLWQKQPQTKAKAVRARDPDPDEESSQPLNKKQKLRRG